MKLCMTPKRSSNLFHQHSFDNVNHIINMTLKKITININNFIIYNKLLLYDKIIS